MGDETVGCSDHGCVFGHPGGMGTNGGCHCLDTRTPPTRAQIRAIRAIRQENKTLTRERDEALADIVEVAGVVEQLATERTDARTDAHRAWAEVERLTRERDRYADALLQAHRDHEATARERDDALGQIERLTREVERLRGLMPTPWTASCEKHGGALAPSPGATCARCDDEVERLRAHVARCK